jgi:predicted nuclease of predicted toxin-antitoxin system
MNFLFDENFPRSARTLIESLGHSVIDFREEGVRGSSDEVVMTMAIEHAAVVLTTDRDFFHTIGRQYEGHHGIVVIALRQPNRSAIMKRLSWFFEHIRIDHLKGRTFQLRDTPWIVYPPIDD